MSRVPWGRVEARPGAEMRRVRAAGALVEHKREEKSSVDKMLEVYLGDIRRDIYTRGHSEFVSIRVGVFSAIVQGLEAEIRTIMSV